MTVEEFTRIKEAIESEKDKIDRIYSRDIGIKSNELFDESENSYVYKIEDHLIRFYIDHFPFYPLVNNFIRGVRNLIDKFKDEKRDNDDLFVRQSKLIDTMMAEIAQNEENSKDSEIGADTVDG